VYKLITFDSPTRAGQPIFKQQTTRATPMHERAGPSSPNASPAHAHGLQISPRLFDQLLSSITDFAYTFDLDGRFTFINKPLLDLWGLRLDEAVGKNFFDLKYPDDLAAKLQRQIQQVIETRQRVVGETPYTSLTGAGGYYQYIFSPVTGPDGSVEAIAGTTRDITEQKRSEARDKFQLALDAALRPLTNPADITLTAARLLGEHLAVDRCAYADIEADQDTMNLTGNYTRGPEVKSIIGRMKFAEFGAQVLQLMREDKPFVVDDVDTHAPPVGDPAAYRATQIQAVICVPLHKDGLKKSSSSKVWQRDAGNRSSALASSARCARARHTFAQRSTRQPAVFTVWIATA
jgi:PAS domain S-box-containing protein